MSPIQQDEIVFRSIDYSMLKTGLGCMVLGTLGILASSDLWITIGCSLLGLVGLSALVNFTRQETLRVQITQKTLTWEASFLFIFKDTKECLFEEVTQIRLSWLQYVYQKQGKNAFEVQLGLQNGEYWGVPLENNSQAVAESAAKMLRSTLKLPEKAVLEDNVYEPE